jgi:hypothetical protein
MEIENLPFQFCYNTRSHSFELIVGGEGIGGTSISGIATTKWAQLAMRELVASAGRTNGPRNYPGQHHQSPRSADEVAVNTESQNVFTSRDLATSDQTTRWNASKVFQMIRTAYNGECQSNLMLRCDAV